MSPTRCPCRHRLYRRVGVGFGRDKAIAIAGEHDLAPRQWAWTRVEDAIPQSVQRTISGVNGIGLVPLAAAGIGRVMVPPMG